MNKEFKVNVPYLLLLFLYLYCMIILLAKSETAINFCRLDIVVKEMTTRYYSILFLLPLLGFMYLCFQRDFTINQVLRKGKKRIILFEQQNKVLVFSLLISFVFFAICLASFREFPLYNWNSSNSMYFSSTLRVSEFTFSEMILLMYGICVLRFYILGNLINLCFWYSNSLLFGNILVIIFLAMEISTTKIKLITQICSVDYGFWVDNSLQRLFIIGVLLWGTIITFLYWHILRKKEFFTSEKSK